jgi:hypothetical protein
MKAILLLAAIHLLIAHQSRKKIHPGKAVPVIPAAYTDHQLNKSGFIFSSLRTGEQKDRAGSPGTINDARKGKRIISCKY